MKKEKKSPTKRLLTFAIGFVVIFGGAAILGTTMGWIGGESEGTEVETAKAKRKTITQVVSASGKIQPEVEVIMRPDVSGEIIELSVKEGDYVRQGDLLMRLKPDTYRARIDEINSSLLTQKARLEQARANLLEAETRFRQQKTLYEQEAISEADFMTAKTNYEAQKANLEAARYQVQSVEAQLDQAKEELEKTIIRAPRDGTISKLAVEQGERVLGNTQTAGTELMRIAEMRKMEVQVQVNENDIVNVAAGDTTIIEVDAYPERTFQGIVTEIANSAEIIGSGTSEQVTNYEVKVRINTPHNLDMGSPEQIVQQASMQEMPDQNFYPTFKPGMSATVDIETETVFNVVSVPIQAVTVRDFAKDQPADSAVADSADSGESLIIPKEDLRKVVFVVQDGKAHRREVDTGISDNTHIQVLSGLEAGEEIVVGSYRTLSQVLENGDKVSVSNQNMQVMAGTDN